MDNIIIGLTGPFGSGCSYIAEKILVNNFNAEKISLASILKSEIRKKGIETNIRSELQNHGDDLRKNNGPDYLAKESLKLIKNKKQLYVVDGIRNKHEVEFYKKNFGRFYLFSIIADRDIRWARVKAKYNGNESEFDRDDIRDRDGKEDWGQQVSKCYQAADVIISNNANIGRSR